MHQLRQQALRGEQIDHCEKGHGRNHIETDRPIHHGVVLVYARIGGRNGSLCHGTLSPLKRSRSETPSPTVEEPVKEATSRSELRQAYMPCSAGSAAMSAEISTTGCLLVFFHQCDRPPFSTESSPVLCSIGTWQWLEYSVIEPDTT